MEQIDSCNRGGGETRDRDLSKNIMSDPWTWTTQTVGAGVGWVEEGKGGELGQW